MKTQDPTDMVSIETKRELQEWLKGKGLYRGPVDEIIGRGTRQALLNWAEGLDGGGSLPIATVGGVEIYRRDDGIIEFTTGMTIDADGSPHAYHPGGCPPGLDYLGNAGRPGNWWGIATHDGQPDGRPVIQGKLDPAPGFYVSTTALINSNFGPRDPRRYINSETVPFVVIPGGVKWARLGLGQRCRVTNLRNNKSIDAIVADIGPRNHIGEGSIALAKALDVPHDPRNGGVQQGIKYEIFTE